MRIALFPRVRVMAHYAHVGPTTKESGVSSPTAFMCTPRVEKRMRSRNEKRQSLGVREKERENSRQKVPPLDDPSRGTHARLFDHRLTPSPSIYANSLPHDSSRTRTPLDKKQFVVVGCDRRVPVSRKNALMKPTLMCA